MSASLTPTVSRASSGRWRLGRAPLSSITEMFGDINTADQHCQGATDQALELSHQHWPDDVLTSIPRARPKMCLNNARLVGRRHPSREDRAATAHAGLNPSMCLLVSANPHQSEPPNFARTASDEHITHFVMQL